jgi:endogenous inhibitor of DNA gyrase (YacG/DUF329 family)
MADLGRWLSGDYRVPGPPDLDADPNGSTESGQDAEAGTDERTQR